MRVPNKSLIVSTIVSLSGAALVVACSGSETTTPGQSSSGTSGTIANDAGGSSSGDSGNSSSGDSGNSSSGDSGGSKKANGQPCSAEGTGNTECESGVCASQGTGGGVKKTFCTIVCTQKGMTDPICADAVFTGKCRDKGYCEVK